MKKDKLKIIASACTGAVIGGALGVLFAPRKGSETREKIKESFTNLKIKLQGLDKEDVKTYIEKKLDELDIEIAKLDTEIEYKKAKKQAKDIILDAKEDANQILKEMEKNSLLQYYRYQ